MITLGTSFKAVSPGSICVVPQRCFPATERNYVLTADPAQAKGEAVDFFETPTTDAVLVESFYRRFGVRTFNGQHPYDGDDAWNAFLGVQFRPVLENALRQSIGQYRCVQLNNTCAYVQNATAIARGQLAPEDNVRNLADVQAEIAETLQADLTETLGGEYFEDIRFRLLQVRSLPPSAEGFDLTADLRIAREDADALAAELNDRRR